MRNWIDLIVEYADPEDRAKAPFYRGAAHYAPKALVDRPGFKEWFAGSKVCGPTGDPLIAFHGSFEQFSEFKLQSEKRRAYGFNRLGYWFDIDPRTPEHFAGYGNKKFMDNTYEQHAGGVMPCVLSIKKPFHLDSEYLYRDDADELQRLDAELNIWHDLYQVQSRRDDLGNLRHRNGGRLLTPDGKPFDEAKYRKMQKHREQVYAKIIKVERMDGDRIDGWDTLMKQLPRGPKSTDAEVDAFRDSLIAEGHDGIYLGDTAADFGTRDYAGTDWWIAFHPNQIKSILAPKFSDANDIMS